MLLRFWVVGDLYGIDIFVSSFHNLNLDVIKESLLAGGVFRCSSGLSCNDCNSAKLLST